MVISVFTTGLFRNIIYRKTLYLYLLLILFMTFIYDLTIFFETITNNINMNTEGCD
jgi:hypothetical protein